MFYMKYKAQYGLSDAAFFTHRFLPSLYLQVLQQPHGITIFEDNIYWSDRYTSQIMRTNKFHGGNITTLLTSVYQCMGIAMDHPVKQPLG